MSTPRPPDGFDERPEDQRGWSEPTHLGGGSTGSTPPPPADRGWEPPGWSLPDAAPDRTARPAQQQPVDPPRAPEPWDRQEVPPPQEERRGGLLGGLFGGRSRAPRRLSDVEQVFTPKAPLGDLAAWGHGHGWVLSDGTGPEDGVLVELTRSAPVRPGKDEVPSTVLRGRADGLDLVAFDIVSPYGRRWVATHAVTAAPVLVQLPAFRLTPARFWRHGTGGLLQIPSGDPEFDTRWVMLAAEDAPQLRRVVEDPVVRQALLGSDDGDELWSAVGFVAAIRPDGHRPLLVEHHARILAAVTAALSSWR